MEQLSKVNDLASRLANAVREQLPELDQVAFMFDILPDFNGPSQPGENLAVIVGLLINESLTRSVNPGTLGTNFGPIRVNLQGELELDLSAQLGIGLAIEIPSNLSSAPITHILVSPPAGNENLVKTQMSLEARSVGSLGAGVGFGSL